MSNSLLTMSQPEQISYGDSHLRQGIPDELTKWEVEIISPGWLVNLLYEKSLIIIGHFQGYNNHHHHVVPPALIFLTLSHHFSLSFIAFGRSSGLHPVSLHSCSMYVRAGNPAFAWPYVGGPLESVLASPAVSCVSGSSNLYSFRDGRQVAV